MVNSTMKTLLLLSLFLVSCTHLQKPEKVNIRVTAYCPQEKDHIKYKNQSAAGTNLVKGRSIACDWSIYPVGTIIRFNNNNFVVEDYGSYIMKDHRLPTIDLYVSNKREMRNWGVREVEAEIIQMGDYEKSAEILKSRLKYRHCNKMFIDIIEKSNIYNNVPFKSKKIRKTGTRTRI